jgi:hypothetical protein
MNQEAQSFRATPEVGRVPADPTLRRADSPRGRENG